MQNQKIELAGEIDRFRDFYTAMMATMKSVQWQGFDPQSGCMHVEKEQATKMHGLLVEGAPKERRERILKAISEWADAARKVANEDSTSPQYALRQLLARYILPSGKPKIERRAKGAVILAALAEVWDEEETP